MRKNRIGIIIVSFAVVALLQSPLGLREATAQHSHGAPNDANAPGSTMHGGHTGTLDLNTAPLAELQQLPGVNEATAKKIVENRPYARADELITKKILSKPAYDSLKGHITVTKPAK